MTRNPSKPVVNETAVAACHRKLRERMLSGDIGPDKPLFENSLAQELGTSRTPVREALAMLESEGVIRR
ncbi:MAG: GntR family transcriptional regulator, partial [Bifidobacteriaceae bacterium]|nr:GntR family transcriptional regulator [Bifidobacteriaceae bacterium]